MPNRDQYSLLASVIHELRAPLNACLMSVSLLELKAEEPEAVRRAAEVIRRNLDREAQLIRDLADIVQIVSGDIQIKREPLTLDALVERVLATAQAAAAERGVELDRGGAVVGSFHTDPERVAQALATLLENLIVSRESGERVSIEAFEDDGCARIEAGVVGAPAADATAPSREQKGFAMRLLVAQSLLERLGGTAERDGRGFSVRLPLEGV